VQAEKKVVQAEKKVVEAEKKVVEVEKKVVVGELKKTKAELLRVLGLFSVRGMMEYMEEKVRKELENNENFSRKDAKANAGLTNIDPEKFGSVMTKAYKNYCDEIHDGKRSAEEVSYAGDAIIIRESQRVDYEQVQCIKSFAEYFKYPYQVKLISRNKDYSSLY